MRVADADIRIDRGGTFTDVWASAPNKPDVVLKLLSVDPGNYADAPTEGMTLDYLKLYEIVIAKLTRQQASDVFFLSMGIWIFLEGFLSLKRTLTLCAWAQQSPPMRF